MRHGWVAALFVLVVGIGGRWAHERTVKASAPTAV